MKPNKIHSGWSSGAKEGCGGGRYACSQCWLKANNEIIPIGAQFALANTVKNCTPPHTTMNAPNTIRKSRMAKPIYFGAFVYIGKIGNLPIFHVYSRGEHCFWYLKRQLHCLPKIVKTTKEYFVVFTILPNTKRNHVSPITSAVFLIVRSFW
jgi:hypothetical protein